MMRVKGKEFYGENNRWVSGSKDITWLMRPTLEAAMEVTMLQTNEPPSVYLYAAQEITKCLNGAMESSNNAVDLVEKCRSALSSLPEPVSALLYENIALGLLTQHIMGVRELTTTPFPGDDGMREAVGQSMILSALPEEDRAKVKDMLKRAGAYRRAELDRRAPPGVIKENKHDDTGEGGEAAAPS